MCDEDSGTTECVIPEPYGNFNKVIMPVTYSLMFFNTDEDTLPADVLMPEFSRELPVAEIVSTSRRTHWIRGFPQLKRPNDE